MRNTYFALENLLGTGGKPRVGAGSREKSRFALALSTVNECFWQITTRQKVLAMVQTGNEIASQVSPSFPYLDGAASRRLSNDALCQQESCRGVQKGCALEPTK